MKCNKKQRHKTVYDGLHDIAGKSGIKRVFIVEFHKNLRKRQFYGCILSYSQENDKRRDEEKMNKQEVYEFLDKRGVTYEKTEHPAVFSMKEVPAVELPHPEADAKNLFVRDDKKRNYFLITVRGDKRVDLKAFAKDHGTRRLSFASAEDLMEMLGVVPGSVSPFGILNDEERKVTVFLDRDFWKDAGLIGVHPNENTATVWLQAEEMAEILREHGNVVEKVEL